MGLISHKISRDKLRPGDHIFSWRAAYIYAHHGIYIGNGKLIHFTRRHGTGTFLDNIFLSSNPPKQCLSCGDQSNLSGVLCSCLDCFLDGGDLYLFDYGVNKVVLMAKIRSGACTTAPTDASEQVIARANYLLLHNCFGNYHPFENNCEDFAIYCKTSLLIGENYLLGRTGQASSVSATSIATNIVSVSEVITSAENKRHKRIFTRFVSYSSGPRPEIKSTRTRKQIQLIRKRVNQVQLLNSPLCSITWILQDNLILS